MVSANEKPNHGPPNPHIDQGPYSRIAGRVQMKPERGERHKEREPNHDDSDREHLKKNILTDLVK